MTEQTPEQPSEQSLLRVLEVTRQLAISCDLNEVLQQVIDAGRAVLGADRGTVFLLDPSSRELYSTVATGVGNQPIRLSMDQGIAGLCARTCEVINVPDCAQDERFDDPVVHQTGYQTRSLLNVPLIGLHNELVGVMQLLNPSQSPFNTRDERIALVLASQAAVAIQRAKLIEEHIVKLKLERDLDLARKIQIAVLPQQVPEVPGYDLACYSQPVGQTGGDIYDLVWSPDHGRLMILLADATGHGIGPALSVIQVRAMFRLGLRLSATLDDQIQHINEQLAEDLEGGRFVTAFLGALDPKQHTVQYHAAGQGPLLQVRASDGLCQWYPASNPPLGVQGQCQWTPPTPLTLEPGDTLALLTDGIYDLFNADKQTFGADRVGQTLSKHRDQSATRMLDLLLDHLRKFADSAPQHDDVTALIIKRL